MVGKFPEVVIRVFTSEYAHTIDAKGRIIMPADFREELGEHFIITKGLDSCLFIYGEGEWGKLSERLRHFPLVSQKARALERFFFSGARLTECDRQGRFLVPANLRSYAMLEKDVVFIGVADRIEVWSKSGWETYNDSVNTSVGEIAEALSGAGLFVP